MSNSISYYQKQKTNKSVRVNLKTLNIIIFSLVVFSGVLYLINISDLTVKGFALKELRSQALTLGDEVRNNKDKVDALQSYYSLNSRAAELNMVAVGDIDYITVPGVVLAKK